MTDSFLRNPSLDPENAMLVYTVPEECQALSEISPCQKINNSTTTLRGSDSLADADTTLSGSKVLITNNGLGLLDNLVTLDKDHLDVARVGHVRVDLSIG